MREAARLNLRWVLRLLPSGAQLCPRAPTLYPVAWSPGKGVGIFRALLVRQRPKSHLPRTRGSRTEPTERGARWGRWTSGRESPRKCARGWGLAGHCVSRAQRVPQRETALTLRAVPPGCGPAWGIRLAFTCPPPGTPRLSRPIPFLDPTPPGFAPRWFPGETVSTHSRSAAVRVGRAVFASSENEVRWGLGGPAVASGTQ